MAAFKAFFLKIWTVITGWFSGLVTRIETFGGMLLTRAHAFIDMLIWNAHTLLSTVLTTITKSLSAPGIALMSAVGIMVVVDIFLLGKIGVIKFIVDTFELVLGLLTVHLWASAVIAGSVILIMICLKELKAIKKG